MNDLFIFPKKDYISYTGLGKFISDQTTELGVWLPNERNQRDSEAFTAKLRFS